MTPHCAESSESQECVSVGQSLPTKCPKSGKQDCSVVQHVLVHRRNGPPEVWKTDEDTSSGRIVWQNVTGEVDLSGKGHETFHALCQYLVPTTTTTTTTTTMAPTTLSSEMIMQHLTTTKCPLNQSAEEPGSYMNEANGLPEIDLFLNPDRKKELEGIQRWVEQNEERLTYDEVREVFK